MDMEQAIAVMKGVQDELGMDLVDAFEYIDDNYDDALPEVQRAHRIMMAGFRRLLMPKEAA